MSKDISKLTKHIVIKLFDERNSGLQALALFTPDKINFLYAAKDNGDNIIQINGFEIPVYSQHNEIKLIVSAILNNYNNDNLNIYSMANVHQRLFIPTMIFGQMLPNVVEGVARFAFYTQKYSSLEYNYENLLAKIYECMF